MVEPGKNLAAGRRNPGFTLMEVLGAVAILGLSNITLATAAIDGLRMIGESSRRADASLLADTLLAELELKAELGELIETGFEESEQEPFKIEVEILDLAEEMAGTLHDSESGDLLTFLASEANGLFAEFRGSNWLLGYLREVHINVQWQDGANELLVTRTAYIYDQQAWFEAEVQEGAANPRPNAGVTSP